MVFGELKNLEKLFEFSFYTSHGHEWMFEASRVP